MEENKQKLSIKKQILNGIFYVSFLLVSLFFIISAILITAAFIAEPENTFIPFIITLIVIAIIFVISSQLGVLPRSVKVFLMILNKQKKLLIAVFLFVISMIIINHFVPFKVWPFNLFLEEECNMCL